MAVTQCPKCGSTRIEGDECLHCGIYISKYVAFVAKGGLAQLKTPAPTPPATPAGHMMALEFKIAGAEMQFVELALPPSAAAIAEAGSMIYMEDGIDMTTTLSDGSQHGGVLGAVLSAGKRVLANESLFITTFTNSAPTPRKIAFGAPTPGKIVAIPLAEVGGEILAQKDAFLAAARGLTIDIAVQKRFAVGLFGGQGFVMERLKGDGVVFVNTGGTTYERTLGAGEVLKAEAGSIVALQPTVTFDIEYVGSVKSALFGGQGIFFATLRGPGRVWLQSLTLSKLIARIVSRLPRPSSPSSGSSSDTGTAIVGALGGLFGGGGGDGSDGGASDGGGSDSGGGDGSEGGSGG